MDIFSAIAESVKFLLLFIGAMAVLLVVLTVIIARLSSGNPLKRILVLLCYRIAATRGAGIVAVPLEPVPGVDAAYDIGATILLLLYWLSFFVNLAGPQARGSK